MISTSHPQTLAEAHERQQQLAVELHEKDPQMSVSELLGIVRAMTREEWMRLAREKDSPTVV